MQTVSPDLARVKSGMKAAWMAGDFGQIAPFISSEGEDFVQRIGIKRGDRALDVACGTGNTALPLARAGAKVTGVDIATNLLEQAKQRAAAEKLDILFEEGDAEQLPVSRWLIRHRAKHVRGHVCAAARCRCIRTASGLQTRRAGRDGELDASRLRKQDISCHG